MSSVSEQTRREWFFGSRVPYAEAPWARGQPSPYYNDGHRSLRQAMREWVDTALVPHLSEWEAAADIPDNVYQQAAAAGVLLPTAFGATIPSQWHGKFPIIGNVAPGDWDGFHDFILHDEFGRVGGIGLENGLLGGATLCIPVIQKYGAPDLRDRIIGEVLSGKARISLAITEPTAGSDVQGLQTEARPSDDGERLIINGQKKWITGGTYASYFLTLVRETSGAFTLVVIPRSSAVSTRHMTMSGSTTAGTAYVDFDDLELPLNMIVGERGQGLKYIMSNFNHERLFIGMQALRCARVCLEDSIGYALNRKTFGKKLVEQPVIRFKIAHMARQTESLQAWIESLIYQLSKLTPPERDLFLSGPTATLKAHAGLVLENVVREAVQMVGGIGLTRGGRGERIERIWRDVKAITVPGGSEEILLDFGTRRALKLCDLLDGTKPNL